MPISTPSSLAASRRPSAERGVTARRGILQPTLTWVAATTVLAVPWAAFAGLVLHQFYVKGSFLQDAGWFAFVMSQGGVGLANPAAIGGSFFATHIAPILVATSLLKAALPLSDAQFFAAVIGLGHALPGLGVYWLLRAEFGLRRPGATMLAAAIGLAFACNGLALAIVRYPHYEILIVGWAILFLVALTRQRLVAAAVFFILALLTREDAGFHLFGLLFVLVVVNRCRAVPWRAQRSEIIFAALALLYSVAAGGIELVVAAGPDAALTRIYLGQSAFAKLTLGTIAERLLGYPIYRSYLVLPAVAAAIWAIAARNPYILVGYIAFLPWGLLQLIARSDIAGTLSGYYAYPFMIASFWPLLGVMLDRRRRGIPAGNTAPLLAFGLLLALSFVGLGAQYNPGHFDLGAALSHPPSPARQELTDRAIAGLQRSKRQLGVVLVDGSVAALAPDDFAWRETIVGHRSSSPDAVVYFAHGYEADKARAIAAAAGLNRYYRVPGTALRLATAGPVDATAPIAALLAPDLGPD